MKQHIITEQLNELSKNQKDKLDVWFSRHPYTYTIRAVSKIGETGFKNTDPLLTIGQMIEFLDEHCGENCTAWSSDRQCRTREIMPIGNFGGLEIVFDPNTVICDALWEAVKEVLQDEKKT